MKASIETQLHEEYAAWPSKKNGCASTTTKPSSSAPRVEANLEQEMERRFVEMEGWK